MLRLSKDWLLPLVPAIMVAAFATTATAQDYPTESIQMINPWTAGGPADTVARPLADEMSDRLGQPVVVENRPGANGMLGSELVAQADPDGYTLLFSHVGPLAISPAVQDEMPFDTMGDFEHVALVATGSLLLAIRPDLPIESVSELIDYAEENPGMTYGSVGQGSTVHLAGEMLAMETGIDLVHVPYDGAAPVITDLLGGRIDMTFLNVAALLPHMESGDVRGLAVTTLEPFALAPDLPTISEVVPDYNVASWYGLSAPAGTPPKVVELISDTVAEILEDPEMEERLLEAGLQPEGTSPAEHTAQIDQELEVWRGLVDAVGLEPQE